MFKKIKISIINQQNITIASNYDINVSKMNDLTAK